MDDLLTRVRSHEGYRFNFATVEREELESAIFRRALWLKLLQDAESWDSLGSAGQAAAARELAERVARGTPLGCLA